MHEVGFKVFRLQMYNRILKSRGEFQTAKFRLACVSCAVTAAKYHSIAASDSVSPHYGV